ncbi:YihY family inner membrane protein [Campylobacter sp. FMV-PI01]|uniref:YihY family inner membrane protein n=1 Tax=Campylobacter portucalensis TaxID=2608384 RepID=A0A6L5WKN0_9BACT|nr:YihY family inner membrane protein [Campylobacter portucalensis]
MYKKLKVLANYFYDKELLNHAASLSYHTILSFIPVLLLSLSIFTQLPSFKEHYEKMKNFIFSNLLPSHQDTITEYIEQFLSNSVNLGILGFIAIIVTTIMFFDNYKYVVNKILNLKPNGFWKDFSKYWTLITLAPLGLGLSFFLSTKFQDLLNQSELTSWINIVALLPYFIIWAIFCLTYIISADNILLKNIIISSFITSLIWNFSKFIFIKYAFYNKTYLSIYGSFSVLLFFFVWIYIGWIVFLYGFKICIYLENTKN